MAKWNHETKAKLNEKVTSNINDIGSLIRHVIRASKSTELLAQAAKNFASQESVIHNSCETLKKMNLVRAQYQYHQDEMLSDLSPPEKKLMRQSAIERSMDSIEEIQDQLKSIQR